VGTDSAGKPWACTTGQQQSPINVVTTAAATKALANEHRATFELGAAVSSNGSNVLLVNNGQGVQVSWTQTGFSPKVLITVKGMLNGRRSAGMQGPVLV
jgi:carbonic anhydrase